MYVLTLIFAYLILPAKSAAFSHVRKRLPERQSRHCALTWIKDANKPARSLIPARCSSRDELSRRNDLNLITFDLDDTIFPIGPVVRDANSAMIRELQRRSYTDACNDAVVAASKQIRAELRDAGGDVITYTELRKRSIRREMERLTGTTNDDDQPVIDAVFDAWLEERQASAERNLYPYATEALVRIRELYPDVIVGAVTNGRGDPRDMPSLSPFFDFCVSGEDEGVFPQRKPERGIYEAALAEYNRLREAKVSELNEMDVNWIHVGDDLANDVGASAECGALAVWFDMDSENPSNHSWSTATEEEIRRREKLDELARDSVRAKISTLNELPDAVLTILS